MIIGILDEEILCPVCSVRKRFKTVFFSAVRDATGRHSEGRTCLSRRLTDF